MFFSKSMSLVVYEVKVLFLIVIKINYLMCIQNELVVRVTGGPFVAQLLAEEHGHLYKGPVRGFKDTYILIPLENVYENHQKRGFFPKKIANDQRVLWAEEQHVKLRQKRDFIAEEDIPKERVKRVEDIPSSQRLNSSKLRQKRDVMAEEGIPKQRVKRVQDFQIRERKTLVTASDQTFNDELWSQQWYLRDTRSRLDLPKLDLNVLPVYYMGITGKGIRISILDDGIEYTHDDLRENYDPEISWDCNEDDNDPYPRLDAPKSNNHGTRCAGEVSMMANNRKCGVGIAFGARVGAVKMLDGIITDRIEGTALGYAQHLVDIYSASWGPNDDGKTVDGPGRLAVEAIERGIREGRGGKGVIYVWASGNGGNNNDNCNCDGYLASPYTISIGSASQTGKFPWYGEACASTLAVTYSSGAYKDQMITTTDIKNSCTTKHTGTSASAPLAAGIIALALEVNGNLTWRDVQHLITWTSELAPLTHNPGWQQNSAGFWVSDRFGFGLMNAFGLIREAINWKTVPERKTCRNLLRMNSTLSSSEPVKIEITSTGCKQTDHELKYLEHVEVQTNINYTSRGSLQIKLYSPTGTMVNLLAPRKLDKSSQGFQNWTFMSVMTWGEIAEGIWTIVITDVTSSKKHIGSVGDTMLILHGTRHLPPHMREGPRNYDENYNRLQNRVKLAHAANYETHNLVDRVQNLESRSAYLPQDIMEEILINDLYH
ncbi:neuroendocrine convertase 1-like [Diabrotica virgifera virgifera]|uniref:P/Homo B domain-containing protein n=1 Tax=Diabrotica virgifera virgifera TaxID=50390 RepID=A0ABM5JQW2_DIAVI|nr:neuroendocrine convertase 1-like [Diabrotica virgifera virgifera]